nr:unnamed protein product [Spirometra erinaceieuropaei]
MLDETVVSAEVIKEGLRNIPDHEINRNREINLKKTSVNLNGVLKPLCFTGISALFHMMSMSTQGASEDSLRRRRQTVYGDCNEFSSEDLTATRVAEPAFFTGEVPPENRLDQAYESLEYDVTQNPILIKELEEQAVKKKHRTSALRYTLLFLIGFCTGFNKGQLQGLRNSTLTCADNEYNSIAALVFTTPEKSLHTLFHDPPDTFSPFALCMFLPYIFAITCLTFGLSVPAGLFIPSLLIGATWGRIIGNLLNKFQPALFPDPGKFALIGAAAQLGGIVRMIASLTVILMEASGSIIVGLPLLLTLVAAKYTGDWFTESIYDTHISLNKIALLPWEPDPFSVKLRAFEVMSCPAVALDPVMSVRDLVRIVRGHPHHAFPLVQGVCDPARFVYGFLVGMISSQHLALILKKRAFLPLGNEQFHKLTIEDYDDAYPRFEKLPVSYSSVPLTISAVIIAHRGRYVRFMYEFAFSKSRTQDACELTTACGR